MEDVERLSGAVKLLEQQLGHARIAVSQKKDELAEARRRLAAARKAVSNSKTKMPESGLLREAQQKVQDLRSAAAAALRARGATIADVEAVIGVRYERVRQHDEKKARKARRDA